MHVYCLFVPIYVKIVCMDELSAFRALRAVSDHGTVTAAAGVLRLSPSAVSQQIKRLERLTRQDLLTPSGRRVTLTPAAHTLLDTAGPAVDHLEAVLGLARSPSDAVSGQVRVGAFTTAIRHGVVAAVAELRKTHPALTCSLAEVDPMQALHALSAGTIDVAVTHHWDGQPQPSSASLTAVEVGNDVADVLCRRETSLPANPTFTDFADYNWVSTGAGTLCHAWLTRLFADHRIRPRILMEISDFSLHIDFVAAGLGLALVPRLGRPTLPDTVRAVQLAEPPQRRMYVVTRSRQTGDAAIRAVSEQLTSSLSTQSVH